MIIDPWVSNSFSTNNLGRYYGYKIKRPGSIDTHFQTMTDKTFLQARRLSKLCIENVFRYSEWIIIIQSIGKGQD